MPPDALETWWSDDFLITQKLVYDLELREGLYAVQGKKGDLVDLPAQHGQSWRERPYDAGAFTLSMWIGSNVNRQEVDQWWEAVVRATTPSHRLVRFQRQTAAGLLRECYGEVADGIEPKPEAQGWLLRCAIAVDVPAGFWQDTADSTIATVAGSALPQTLACTPFAGATMPMPYNAYTVSGAIGNPTLQVLDDLTGAVVETWQYLGTIPTGQSITFNSATWAVTGGGGFVPDPSLIRHSGPRFLTMRPARPGGTPTLKLSGANGGAATRLSVTGRACYNGGG